MVKIETKLLQAPLRSTGVLVRKIVLSAKSKAAMVYAGLPRMEDGYQLNGDEKSDPLCRWSGANTQPWGGVSFELLIFFF